MHTTYFWHKLHLYRSKIILILLLVGTSGSIWAQTKVYNRRFLENYDEEEIHFGFFFGTGFNRFEIKQNELYYNNPNNVLNIYSPANFSFRVGMAVNKYINRRWDIRSTPGINITGKQLYFDIDGTPKTVQKDARDLDFFELPVYFKYKSDRRKNSRMYMLAGGNFVVESNIRKGARLQTAKLPTKNADLCIEYGFGYEQFMQFGKLTGELRFSHGLVNLMKNDAAARPWSEGIGSLRSHAVSLYLFFE